MRAGLGDFFEDRQKAVLPLITIKDASETIAEIMIRAGSTLLFFN